MNTLDREDIISKIVSSRVQDILVPSNAFGRPMLIKTTKKDLVNRIRAEYAEGQTNLKFRLRPNTNSAIVEAVGEYTRPKNAEKQEVEKNIPDVNDLPKRKRGRPTNAERAARLAAEQQKSKSENQTSQTSVPEKELEPA